MELRKGVGIWQHKFFCICEWNLIVFLHEAPLDAATFFYLLKSWLAVSFPTAPVQHLIFFIFLSYGKRRWKRELLIQSHAARWQELGIASEVLFPSLCPETKPTQKVNLKETTAFHFSFSPLTRKQKIMFHRCYRAKQHQR